MTMYAVSQKLYTCLNKEKHSCYMFLEVSITRVYENNSLKNVRRSQILRKTAFNFYALLTELLSDVSTVVSCGMS